MKCVLLCKYIFIASLVAGVSLQCAQKRKHRNREALWGLPHGQETVSVSLPIMDSVHLSLPPPLGIGGIILTLPYLY